MSEPITYMGIDAHKAKLQVALLVPHVGELVTWTVRNEVRRVDRLHVRAGSGAKRPAGT